MTHLILLCNLENIECESLCTSSSRYELEFALSLSKKVDRVSIVSPKAAEQCARKNMTLYPCSSGDFLRHVTPVVDFTSELIEDKDQTVVMFWGYNPRMIYAFSRLKSSGVKIVSMIYDTHVGQLSGKPFVKKALIDLFYRLGMWQIHRLDGVFLFKEKAKRHLRLKKKTCVILPAADAHLPAVVWQPTDRSGRDDGIVFLFSGTLCAYNGICELLEAFSSLQEKNISLQIYGDGPLQETVQHVCEKDPRIFYGGRVRNEELTPKISAADVLLNLRQVPSVVNDFAFPSKTVEYMMAGKPVISTNVSDVPAYGEAVFLLDSISASDIADMLKFVCTHPELRVKKAERALQYLKEYHDPVRIMEQAYHFMFRGLFSEQL